jgi:hypothetical protein
MAIRRRCRGTCRSARRCLEHLWFDVKHRGTRFRMPVNDFAVPRMEPNKQRPVQSMEEVRDWERLFVGEIKARRDPRIKPARKETPADLQSVAGFLDAYFERHLRPAGIRSLDTAAGRIKVLKQHFGDLPIKALEEPAPINRFKTESEYSRRVEISTLHKVLAILRAAIRWGQAQTPPLIDKSPFHRFGVRLNTKAETVRDRRISREEEKRLLDAALAMNTWEHRYVGPLMHDRIIWRARAVLPTRRDACHPEQASRLGHSHDRYSWSDNQGQGEPAHSVRSERPPRGRPESTRETRTERVRVRNRERRVRG